MFGVLRPGDLLCSITGAPYDTMEEIIGIRPSHGSLAEFGITYTQCDLTILPRTEWQEEITGCCAAQKPKLVLIQRSRGYKRMRALSESEIAAMISTVKRGVAGKSGPCRQLLWRPA